MNVHALLDAVLQETGSVFAHRGVATLSDSHTVPGDIKLAAELAVGTAAPVVAGDGSILPEGAGFPSGLALTIGGDSYTLTSEVAVEDSQATLGITPVAITTYAVDTAVVLSDSVTWDLVALDAQVVASDESRNPGTRRQPTDHAVTVHVLKSKLTGLTSQRLADMELLVDGNSAPIISVVDDDPSWRLVAGGA